MHRLLLLLLLTLTAMPFFSHAVEEPKYEVIRPFDTLELRRYAPCVVAEVVLNARAEDAGSRAFPILAGCISGKNKGERKFAMTAPVTQTTAPATMEMTAPVMQAAVPGGQWATIRYSGPWSQANCDEHLGKLQTALAAAGVATPGQPVLARCNAPFTPWFMRRNEIRLALR